MTFMKVVGYQEKSNILAGTSLGWFLEIFFVYLATGMFSIHLLYSGRISYKGDYIGLKVRNSMIQSLTTVGFFVSVIAIILFLVEYSKQLFVVIYFIGYFLMVTLLFVLFLDIFEPISIFVLIKIIETAKNYGPKPAAIMDAELVQEEKIIQEEIYVPPVNIEELKAGISLSSPSPPPPLLPSPISRTTPQPPEEKTTEKSLEKSSAPSSTSSSSISTSLRNKVLHDSLKTLTAILVSFLLLIILNGVIY